MNILRPLLLSLFVLVLATAVSAQTTLDITAARNQILNGVATIHSGEGTGYMVVYGDNAAPISYFPEGAAEGATVAVAQWGNGRVLAMPDHQMLNMGQYGDDGTTGQFYKNGLAWVTDDASQNITIVTYNQGTADWLNANGYPNTTVTNESGLSGALATADVFVGWLGSSQSQANLDALATFVQNGGGLMLAEYGAGYTFWWTSLAAHEAPGNQLLRDIGIGFSSRNRSDSGLLTVNRANEQVTLADYYTIMGDQAAATPEQVAAATQLLAHIGDTLPPGDPLPSQMAAVFTSDVRATINTPVTDPIDKATLSAEMDILRNLPPNQVTAHPTAEELYGTIAPDAPRLTNQVVSIDTDVSRWHSTGLYVVPGEIVEITVPVAIIDQGFRVLVSGHGDNISPRDEWWRVPYGVQRQFAADTTTIEIANAFGGAIYLDVGVTPPADNGVADFDITIDNAIAAPYFVLGETTNADWIASIRDNPAPYAEFVSDRIAFSVPSSSVRDLDDAEALLQLWDDVVARQDYIGALEDLRTMPERVNIDVQISVGLLHAGYPIQGPTYTVDGMTDYNAIVANGSWGYYHELGHEMQRRPDKAWGWNNPYTFDGDVEVTVNIFANAALEALNPGNTVDGWGWSSYPDLVMERAITSVAAGGVFDFKDPYPFYFQLADGFGWEAYRTVFETYHDDVLNDVGALPLGGTAEKTEWLMRWSQSVNYDMRCYMVDIWGLQVSLTAAQTAILDALPCWLPVLGNTPDQMIETDDTLTLDLQNDALAINGQVSVMSVSAPSNGTLTDNGNGTYTYTPSAAGTDTLFYTLQSSVGNTQQFSVTITATEPLVCPDALMVVSTADSGACTLRTAIANASPDDTITFDPAIAGQMITLDSTLIIDKSLTIDGAGMTFSGGNTTDVFDVAEGVTLFRLIDVNVMDGRSDTGAMIVRWNATALIQNSTFANNHTTFYDGGAIHSQGRLLIDNSTFSGNTGAAGAASVLGLRGEGHSFINITVVDNQSPDAAAIQSNDGTVAAVYNSIIANNSLDCSGVPFAGGTNNWFGDASCDGTADGDPMLGALQDNGGATLTHMPLPGSLVIGAGQALTCLVNDQIGNFRDGCDIGAVQAVSAPLHVGLQQQIATPHHSALLALLLLSLVTLYRLSTHKR